MQPDNYFLVSIHREENVDHPDNLAELIDGLNQLAGLYKCPVIVSTHPRTRKRLESNYQQSGDSEIIWMKPFGFHDYNRLQLSAKCVISDSGTIAEESSILGFPAITPRFSIERPEAMDTGAIIACGYSAGNVIRAVQLVIEQHKSNNSERSIVPEDYCISNTSQRVINLIIGTAKLSNEWDGIR